MKKILPDLVIGDLVINPPIIQGGMGVRVSRAGLASAVANEGGVGIISCALIGGVKSQKGEERREADVVELRKQIRSARELTKGVLGVNIMVVLTNYEAMVRAAVDAGIDFIISGAGLPLRLPEYAKEDVPLVPVVSSGRALELILKTWQRKYKRSPAVNRAKKIKGVKK